MLSRTVRFLGSSSTRRMSMRASRDGLLGDAAVCDSTEPAAKGSPSSGELTDECFIVQAGLSPCFRITEIARRASEKAADRYSPVLKCNQTLLPRGTFHGRPSWLWLSARELAACESG